MRKPDTWANAVINTVIPAGKSRHELVTVSEVKRNCIRVTSRHKVPLILGVEQ